MVAVTFQLFLSVLPLLYKKLPKVGGVCSDGVVQYLVLDRLRRPQIRIRLRQILHRRDNLLCHQELLHRLPRRTIVIT